MDQDAFRKLLVVPKQGRAAQRFPIARDSLLPSKTNASQPQPTVASSKSEFKPRKIKKKTDLDYRDRAAERRQGVAGDFAEASVLENFEKQHADEDKEAVEEQRRYLGGDSEHTILVKGLDFALLEQTRARAAVSTSKEDDEMLEAAFHGVALPPLPEPSVPDVNLSSSKKRTREDILRELKQKREASSIVASGSVPDEVKALEEAKREGKFKPIGFKPIGSSSASAKDKVKAGKDKESRRKKKRKVEIAEGSSTKTKATATTTVSVVTMNEGPTPNISGTTAVQMQKVNEQSPQQESQLDPAPPNEDLDIFAEAGEYEGVNFDDDDDGNDEESLKRDTRVTNAVPEYAHPLSPKQPAGRKWFDDDEPLSPPPEHSLRSLPDDKGKGKGKTQPTSVEERAEARNLGVDARGDIEAGQDREAERSARLAPLASSAVPSIRDILAADSALEAEQKRRARKEKRKAGGGGGGGADESEVGKKVAAEAKLNRDYQKLKAYTEKKRGAGS
ncbi:hypothetical protein EW145_g3408 [Phellinidium pouzarii]|uniref:RED-like N-terminal domain-containing protein n=1 Tax=Phellinidium pouzarii TaxID=167371 RepID=A0A4S4L7G3_9AGAM|nr:hypothetical protein EW145_g3408 [Phellinidium pouzarii]